MDSLCDWLRERWEFQRTQQSKSDTDILTQNKDIGTLEIGQLKISQTFVEKYIPPWDSLKKPVNVLTTGSPSPPKSSYRKSVSNKKNVDVVAVRNSASASSNTTTQRCGITPNSGWSSPDRGNVSIIGLAAKSAPPSSNASNCIELAPYEIEDRCSKSVFGPRKYVGKLVKFNALSPSKDYRNKSKLCSLVPRKRYDSIRSLTQTNPLNCSILKARPSASIDSSMANNKSDNRDIECSTATTGKKRQQRNESMRNVAKARSRSTSHHRSHSKRCMPEAEVDRTSPGWAVTSPGWADPPSAPTLIADDTSPRNVDLKKSDNTENEKGGNRSTSNRWFNSYWFSRHSPNAKVGGTQCEHKLDAIDEVGPHASVKDYPAWMLVEFGEELLDGVKLSPSTEKRIRNEKSVQGSATSNKKWDSDSATWVKLDQMRQSKSTKIRALPYNTPRNDSVPRTLDDCAEGAGFHVELLESPKKFEHCIDPKPSDPQSHRPASIEGVAVPVRSRYLFQKSPQIKTTSPTADNSHAFLNGEANQAGCVDAPKSVAETSPCSLEGNPATVRHQRPKSTIVTLKDKFMSIFVGGHSKRSKSMDDMMITNSHFQSENADVHGDTQCHNVNADGSHRSKTLSRQSSPEKELIQVQTDNGAMRWVFRSPHLTVNDGVLPNVGLSPNSPPTSTPVNNKAIPRYESEFYSPDLTRKFMSDRNNEMYVPEIARKNWRPGIYITDGMQSSLLMSKRKR